MTIVLVVIGFVIMIVYPALTAVRTSTQRSVTDTNLQALMRATAVFAQANGCLPCPTLPNTPREGFGHVRGDINVNPSACGNCVLPAEGIPPFISLGIPERMARDGWGRWMTMRVDPALTNPPNPGFPADSSKPFIVPPTAPCQCADFLASQPLPSGCSTGGTLSTGCLALYASQKGLCRSGLSVANRIDVKVSSTSSQKAAVVFVSHGPNGRWAYAGDAFSGFSRPAMGPLTCAMGDEECNASDTINFVDAPQGQNFDDILQYLDRNNLVSLLGNGSCQTAW